MVLCEEKIVLTELPKVLWVVFDRSKPVRYGGRKVNINNIFLDENEEGRKFEYTPCSIVQREFQNNHHKSLVRRDGRWFTITYDEYIFESLNEELEMKKDEEGNVMYFNDNDPTCMKVMIVFLERRI